MRMYTGTSTSTTTLVLATAMMIETPSCAFTSPQQWSIARIPSEATHQTAKTLLLMVDLKENEVVELIDDDNDDREMTLTSNEDKDKTVVAPFLSQGQISEEAMEMDWNDPKQARVMLYIILSLMPVLFLIPLMLGSRDLIPVDALPPVPLN
jgi:hypothetical protein